MKKFLSGLCATALAATFAATSIMPVSAAPMFVPNTASAQSDVVNVDNQIWRKGNYKGNKNWNNNNNWNNGKNWNNNNNWNNGKKNWNGNNFRRNGNYAYYHGHRGYPYYRNGYREYNGFWFPAGAFIAGAVIGGAIANNNNYNNNYSGGEGHVSWCYNRYRSYRAYDNTFQPYNGPRQQCYSPYD